MHAPHARKPLSILPAVVLTLVGCTSEPSAPRLRATQGVRGIYEDSRGALWIVSAEWLCRYDPAARQSPFTYFPEIEVGSMAAAVQEDRTGRILIQSKRGILSYADGRTTRLEARSYPEDAVWDARPGDLWFGVDQGVAFSEREGSFGVYRYRDGECVFLPFPRADQGARPGFHALTAPMMQADDGTLWFGTFEAAFGFDGETFEILGRERMGRTDDPRDVGLRGHVLDSRGLLWMADNGLGVYVFDGTEVTHFTALHGLRDQDTEGPALDRSFSIGEDRDGVLWFGTAGSGVWRYAPSPSDPIRTGTFTHFGPDDGLPCQNIWTMYRTRAGELLFAGELPGGIYRFDGYRFERTL